MYNNLGISEKIINLSNEVEEELKDIFKQIDKTCEINSLKVINAFQKNNLAEMHLNTSTGYGIDEPGRNKI